MITLMITHASKVQSSGAGTYTLMMYPNVTSPLTTESRLAPIASAGFKHGKYSGSPQAITSSVTYVKLTNRLVVKRLLVT